MFTWFVLSLFLLLGQIVVWRSRVWGAGGDQGKESNIVQWTAVREGPCSALVSGAEDRLDVGWLLRNLFWDTLARV